MWVGEYERIINFEQLSHTILLFPFVTWNNYSYDINFTAQSYSQTLY